MITLKTWRDCVAVEVCSLCCQPIAYRRHFYHDPDHLNRYVHADCLAVAMHGVVDIGAELPKAS